MTFNGQKEVSIVSKTVWKASNWNLKLKPQMLETSNVWNLKCLKPPYRYTLYGDSVTCTNGQWSAMPTCAIGKWALTSYHLIGSYIARGAWKSQTQIANSCFIPPVYQPILILFLLWIDFWNLEPEKKSLIWIKSARLVSLQPIKMKNQRAWQFFYKNMHIFRCTSW